MKKLILSFLVVLISMGSYAQEIFTIGPKVGISQSYMKVDKTINDVKYKTGDARVGFQVGAFARLKLSSFYIQPELLFSSVGGTINLNDPAQEDIKVNYNRIDVPVLVGLKASAFRVNVGPVATFNIDSKNKSANEVGDEIKNRYKTATLGVQAGVGLDISKFIFDLKYETGLASMCKSINVAGTSYSFDQRAQQIILSVGYKIL
jgi:hypothetical protein